ncbi:aminotransferase [Tetragenococcus halophilus subsp. flandriensis]|uniref:MalY/PatB family protein n=1 Tax=Tetragenococcus halophilus TaxID=51669 RepID=UPI0023E938E2|nr:MalY/PatB family protein [Tetragenococcus halophilus]GMA08167.1 aminotransferase [Tetragenococcus halophilus subsp. flandriensis]
MDVNEFAANYYRKRKDTDSLKWDALKERYGDENLLPLWVADTEFSVPDAVQQALQTKIKQGIFGYSLVPEDYFSTYENWQKRHHQQTFAKEWLFFSTGVVQALYDLVDCFTEKGEAILIQPPVYYPFFNVIQDKKRQLVTSDLISGPNNYRMDFADLEKKIKKYQVKLSILCSPHNPVGRVWKSEELRTYLNICTKNNVLVIADEIHSDLILPGNQFVSAAEIAKEEGVLENVVICNAPSKTFNLASLLNAHIWIPHVKQRESYQNWCQENRHTENSSLGQIAAQAAYQSGDQWLNNFLALVTQNYNWIKEQLYQYIPQIEVTDLQGTYLLWLDLRKWIPPEKVKYYIQDQAKLAVDFGEWFSTETKGFIRINLATSLANLRLVVKCLVEVNKMVKFEENYSKSNKRRHYKNE